MKLLVTGAAGFIGSHLCERLAASGHNVVGVDAFTPYYDPAIKRSNAELLGEQGVEVRELDLATAELTDVTAGVDFCFHLAAQPGISATTSFDSYLTNNVVATARLLEACINASIGGFVNIATSSVYGRIANLPESTAPQPISVYGVTKLAAEQLVLAAHRDGQLRANSLRLFSVYGPRERPDKLVPRIMAALSGQHPLPLYEGSDKHIRSYTYISDIVDGIVASMERFEAAQGEIINLGNPDSSTTGDMIRIAEAVFGKTVEIDRQPPRPGDQERTEAVIDKANKLLDYQPKVSLEQGLAETMRYSAG